MFWGNEVWGDSVVVNWRRPSRFFLTASMFRSRSILPGREEEEEGDDMDTRSTQAR
jgi:hypothetical protein